MVFVPPSLVEASTDDVVSVGEIKTMLSISGAGQDNVLEICRDAAVEAIDPAKGGYLPRSLRPTTWELRLPSFYSCWPSVAINLPYPVVTEVVSVKYDDVDGLEQTLTASTDYRTFGVGDHHGARIEPPYQGSWPAARHDSESVRIRYVAGYAGAAMPKQIKSAVALVVRGLMSNAERNLYLSGEDVPGVRARRWVVSDAGQKVIDAAVARLVSAYRW